MFAAEILNVNEVVIVKRFQISFYSFCAIE